jgi:hypothetical protein
MAYRPVEPKLWFARSPEPVDPSPNSQVYVRGSSASSSLIVASNVPVSSVSRVSGPLTDWTTGAVAPHPARNSPPTMRRRGTQIEEKKWAFEEGVDFIIVEGVLKEARAEGGGREDPTQTPLPLEVAEIAVEWEGTERDLDTQYLP